MKFPASLPVLPRRFDTQAVALGGIRIGGSADFGYAAISADVRAAFEKALSILESCGAQVSADGPGLDPGILEHTLKPIAFTEQAAAVASRTAAELAGSEADYRNVVSAGRHYSGTDYIEAGYRRGEVRNAFLKLFERVDALVTPTVAVTAFEAGQLGVGRVDGIAVDPHLGWSPFTWPINLTGLPAATLPCGFDRDGMSICSIEDVAAAVQRPFWFQLYVMRAPLLAIIAVGVLVFPDVIVGMTEASMTRRPSMPRMRRRASSGASGSVSRPILIVPTG